MDGFIVTQEETHIRLDKLLPMRFPEHSRTYFQYLLERGCILVNGNQLKKREKVRAGDEIEVCFLLTEEIRLEAEAIPLNILFEDEHLIIVDKPAGMVVHPGPGHPRGTFVNALLHHCKTIEKNDPLRPGIVHRLDKDTSGILIAAKTASAHSQLVTRFAKRRIKKTYIAVCIGSPKEGMIDMPIARHPIHRQQMAICHERGKEAKTCIRSVSHSTSAPILSCVELQLITGRTHQIRVHLKYLGTPVLGDPVYGSIQVNKKFGISRQLLHASTVEFEHPVHKKALKITTPIPKDMQSVLDVHLPGTIPS